MTVAPVFIFAGQSNVRTHQVTSVPVELQTPSDFTKIWNIQTQAWETYVAGTNSETVTAGQTVFGPEGEFARLWRADNPGATCYIIKYGVNASSLETDGDPDWDPDHAELFHLAKAEIDAALAALSGVPHQLHSVLWMQGESDSLVEASANAYSVNLTEFIAQVRAQWSASSSKFIIGRITDAAAWTFRAAVRAAQVDVAAAEGNSAIVNTDSYSLQADAIHYDEDGVRSLGAGFYAASAEIDAILPGSYAAYRKRVEEADKERDERWRKQRERIDRISRLVDGVQEKLPDDVPEAQVAKNAEAAVAKAADKLVDDALAFDYARLGRAVRAAERAARDAQAALERYQARKRQMEDEQDDEDVLLLMS